MRNATFESWNSDLIAALIAGGTVGDHERTNPGAVSGLPLLSVAGDRHGRREHECREHKGNGSHGLSLRVPRSATLHGCYGEKHSPVAVWNAARGS